ncbi:ESX secretion-associated protein EspG [Gandjariella thermophila]|uniref:ESX secretion-associated protein EspG n=1 Tax=Gandjariella thermophila TaxID=1931992 RepID=A0A4D4J263_9PSEU|nr:ESX secretion-associated protein EspG [Gandjariella thermophila]GDY29192.1 ESX secretion-associated protein EspG [Gandjariella thermophila]
MRGSFQVSRLAWDVVRQRHGIEEQHHVLHITTPEVRPEDYPALERRAFDELARAGLAWGTTVDGALLDTMSLLARPPLELHGWVGYHNRVSVGAVAAVDGRAGAVLAVLDDEAVHVHAIEPTKLVDAMIGLLPAVPPGRGHSRTVPLDAYRATLSADAAARDAESGWLEGGQSDRLETELSAVMRLVRQPRRGGGRIYAAARDRLGRRRKSQYPVTYIDTESGRWAMWQQPSQNGQLWVTIAPATPQLFRSQLESLLATVHF